MPELTNTVKKDSEISFNARKPGVTSSEAFLVNRSGGALPTSARGFSFQPPIIKTYRAGETLAAGNAVFIAAGDGSKNTGCVDLEYDSTQYLYAADNAPLSITGNMTIECWIRLESNPGVGDRRLFVSKMVQSTNQRSYAFGYQNPAGTYQIVFITSNDGSAQTNGTLNYTIPLDTWTHVAASYTASAGTADIYVNGVSQGTIAGLHTSLFNSTAEFWVGGRTAAANEYYDGQIDDLRVWNTNRTAAQIAANYRVQLTGSETNLQGYWKFNNALTDSTSNATTLTNANGATFLTTPLPFSGGTAFKTEADVSGKYETFVGFNKSLISEGGKASIVIAGEVSGFTGLTIGYQYYLSDTAGGISTTPGTNTRKVGIASSSTTLVITNNW